MTIRPKYEISDKIEKSGIAPPGKKTVLLAIMASTGVGSATSYMSASRLAGPSGLKLSAVKTHLKALRDEKFISSWVGARSASHTLNEDLIVQLKNAFDLDFVVGKIFLSDYATAEQDTSSDDGDGGNGAGEDQTPPASEAKKTKTRTKKPSAAPKPQQTEARRGPVRDEDIPAHLLNDDCDGVIDEDGDGDSVPPAQDSVPRPNRFSSKEEALEHLGEVASRLEGDEDIRLQEPTPVPASWSTVEGGPETMDLFGHTPALAPAAPQVDERPAAAPEAVPAAPTTLPPNAVPIRSVPVRRFKIGETVERVGRGPFRSKGDEQWAMSVDLYVTWAEHKDGVHGNRGKSERYTYSIDVDERIKTFERMLKGGISHARLESGIRGMFNTPWNLGKNNKGKRYLEVSTLCANRGAKIKTYAENDPQSPEYQEAQRRAAAGSHRKHNAAGLNDPYRGKHEDAAAYARKNRSLL